MYCVLASMFVRLVCVSLCLSCLLSICFFVSFFVFFVFSRSVCVSVRFYVIICILGFVGECGCSFFLLYLFVFSVSVSYLLCLLTIFACFFSSPCFYLSGAILSVYLFVGMSLSAFCIMCFSTLTSPLLRRLVYPLFILSIFQCLPTPLFPSPHVLRRVGGWSGAAGVCWGVTLFEASIELVYLLVVSRVSVSRKSRWAWGRG